MLVRPENKRYSCPAQRADGYDTLAHQREDSTAFIVAKVSFEITKDVFLSSPARADTLAQQREDSTTFIWLTLFTSQTNIYSCPPSCSQRWRLSEQRPSIAATERRGHCPVAAGAQARGHCRGRCHRDGPLGPPPPRPVARCRLWPPMPARPSRTAPVVGEVGRPGSRERGSERRGDTDSLADLMYMLMSPPASESAGDLDQPATGPMPAERTHAAERTA